MLNIQERIPFISLQSTVVSINRTLTRKVCPANLFQRKWKQVVEWLELWTPNPLVEKTLPNSTLLSGIGT